MANITRRQVLAGASALAASAAVPVPVVTSRVFLKPTTAPIAVKGDIRVYYIIGQYGGELAAELGRGLRRASLTDLVGFQTRPS